MHNDGRLTSLDALRGLSILLVLVNHVSMYTPWPFQIPDWVENFPATAGVVLFFVISGYSITLSLFRHRDEEGSRWRQIAAFAWRRFWRLQPLAIFWIAFTLLGTVFLNKAGMFGTLHQNLVGARAALFMYANWQILQPGGLGALPVYWSLSVEEQFYVLYPFLFFSGLSRRRFFMVCALAYLLLSLIVRNELLLLYLRPTLPVAAALTAPWYQPLLMGVIVYWLHGKWLSGKWLSGKWLGGKWLSGTRQGTTRASWLRLGGMAAILFLPLAFAATAHADYLRALYTPLVAGLIVLVFVSAESMAARSALRTTTDHPTTVAGLPTASSGHRLVSGSVSVLCWFGRRSYGLYLAHLPVSMVTREIWIAHLPMPAEPGIGLVAASAALWAFSTVVITELLYRVIEKPLTAFGRVPLWKTGGR